MNTKMIANLMVAAAPVLAATEALHAMSGLPWVFAVMMAVAIVSTAFAVTVVVVSTVHTQREPVTLTAKRRARVIA